MSAVSAQSSQYPSMFIAGPTYGEQFAILLKYIATMNKGARIAFFYCDDSFGRDPIPFGKIMCRRLALKLVAQVKAKRRADDISDQVQELVKAEPDFIIFHGFIGAKPFPEAVQEIRLAGLKSKLMVTFPATSVRTIKALGPMAEGLYGVSPYAFWWMEDVPMIAKLREYTAAHYPDVTHRSNLYCQAFVTGLIMTETLRRADAQGNLNYEGICKALHDLRDFDTQGLAPPLTNLNNRFPIARIWRANAETQRFEPVELAQKLAKWIKVGY
jgi:branched-chain amino acid transport system substrate-binding protein